MCTHMFICVYLNVIGMRFTLSNSELHIQTVYTILTSKALSVFPWKQLREWLYLWRCSLEEARSTLTYGSAKVHRLWWSARAVLLLAPVYQIIERQAAFLRMRSLSLCNPIQRASWYLNIINSYHVLPELRVDSSGSGLLCGSNQICRRHDNPCPDLFKTVVAGDKSQKTIRESTDFFFFFSCTVIFKQVGTKVLAVKV